MLKQRTIAAPVKTVGIGVHTGRKVTLRLVPAKENTGILFHRVDVPGAKPIPAKAVHVSDTRLATVLQDEVARISTVEHLPHLVAKDSISLVQLLLTLLVHWYLVLLLA